MDKKKKDSKLDEKDEKLTPLNRFDVNGPDDVEIGDDLGPVERIKEKRRNDSPDDE